jgi:hypothetical protein
VPNILFCIVDKIILPKNLYKGIPPLIAEFFSIIRDPKTAPILFLKLFNNLGKNSGAY